MRKNLGNYVISALFVIHNYGIRNKTRLNLISPKPPPPLSVRQYLLFSFFLSLSFLLYYFFDWGGGGNSLGGKALSPPPPISFFPLFSFLLPLLSFHFSPLSLSLLFLSSLFFFFFLPGGGGRGGGAKARSAPLDPRLYLCTTYTNIRYF